MISFLHLELSCATNCGILAFTVYPTSFLTHISHFNSYTSSSQQLIATSFLQTMQSNLLHLSFLNGLLHCNTQFTVCPAFSITLIFNLCFFTNLLIFCCTQILILLQNDSSVAEFRFDTAEKELSEVDILTIIVLGIVMNL